MREIIKKLFMVFVMAALLVFLYFIVVFIGEHESPFSGTGVRGGLIQFWFLWVCVYFVAIYWVVQNLYKKYKRNKKKHSE